HTGVALANTIHGVLTRFKIQDRVWGVVCDNASNNGKMMTQLQKFGLARLEGPALRVHCVLHVYNLAAKAITLPFRKKRAELELKKKSKEKDAVTAEESDEEDEDEGFEKLDPDEVSKNTDDGLALSMMLDEVGDEEIELPDIISGSAEDDELRCVTKVLFKVSREARRLRYNPGARRDFKDSCELCKVPTPHNIRRDVQIRWNLTSLSLKDTDRTWDGTCHYQQNFKHMPREERFRPEDRQAVRGLLTVLEPLEVATLAMSKADVPLLADVIVQYDALNEQYGKICHDQKLPLYLRHAADRAQTVLNRYYEKTDESSLYRLALLLHPSMRVQYLSAAGWQPDWISSAVEIAETCWRTHYKLAHFNEATSTTEATGSAPSFAFSKLDKAKGVTGDDNEDDDTAQYQQDPLVEKGLDEEPIMYDPLAWWYCQQSAGQERDGLTQMAIDVLSMPGEFYLTKLLF
ncbi:hypothetical protein BDV93DRAFT_458812, partial [Ceratobasidium sp. AG-I]